MAIIALPAQGNTAWYPHYSAVDAAVRQADFLKGEAGIVNLDDFAGANDDAKLTAALTYAAAQTMTPWVQLPGRRVDFAQGGRTPYNGLKIAGPGFQGPKNLEINWTANGSKPVNHMIRLTCGNGTSSWFHSPGTVYDVILSNLAFYGNSNTQMWNQPTGSLYSCEFHSLTGYGMFAMMGNETTKCLATQVILSGHWSCISAAGTQFHFGGSDNSFWQYGYVNIGSPGGAIAANGRPQIIFDSLGKSTIGYIYLTLEDDDDYGGIRLAGSAGFGGVTFLGGAFEGRAGNQPSMRPPIRITGGNWTFVGGWFGQTASNANSPGVVEQTGGNVTFVSPSYKRGDTVTATFPFLYQTGGTAQIIAPKVITSGEQMRVRWSTGVTDTAPLPGNSIS